MAFEVEFSKRLDLFGAEIFAALNDKKVALEAQGKKLYNLSVGTPDFEPMPHIKQALCDAAMVSENWKYSLRDLPERQYAILQQSAEMVRPGGVLQYSTCTLRPEENEQVVTRFLQEHPAFSPRILPLSPC